MRDLPPIGSRVRLCVCCGEPTDGPLRMACSEECMAKAIRDRRGLAERERRRPVQTWDEYLEERRNDRSRDRRPR